MEIRDGVIESDQRRCIDLWLDALATRDGHIDAVAVGLRAQEKFTCRIVRFAALGDDVEGFALTVDGGGGVACLEMLAVAPQASRRGGGRTLLVDALTCAANAGFSRFELKVREENTGAINLYRSAGMTQIGVAAEHPLGGLPMLTFGCSML